MVINLEKIFNFILYLYNFDLYLYIYNRKNFFIGKLGFINFFIKKLIKFSNIIFFLNFYKKIFLKVFFIKLKVKRKKFFLKFFNNYNNFYIKNLIKLDRLGFIINKLKFILLNLGFSFISSLEIDIDKNNFYLLNISKFHPSVSFNDTFYLNYNLFNKILLRTHSTNFQFKIKNFKLPLKVFTIGKVFRPDNDSLHLPIFNQLDIVFINKFLKKIFLKNFFLKFINLFFLKKSFFYRFRPSFFPFTYFSNEVDFLLKSKKSWIELCGMGFINSKVLDNLNINSFIYKGFAIGLGIERLSMVYFDINNLNIL